MKIIKDNIIGKRIFSLLLCVILMLSGSVSALAAEESASADQEQKVYLKYITKYLPAVSPDERGWSDTDEGYLDVNIKVKLSNDNYIDKSSVCSSNKEVVNIAGEDGYIWDEDTAIYSDPECHYAHICAYACGPGAADITFKDRYGKEYAVRVTVLAYENPIKSLKITNVKKGKNLAKYFDKSHQCVPKAFWDKTTKSPKVSIKTKSSWYIKRIDIQHSHYDKKHPKKKFWSQKLLCELQNTKSKTVELKEVYKGDWSYIRIDLYNTKTGAKQTIMYGWDRYE